MSLGAGIPLPSDPVPGEPLLSGAAGRHGQTPPHHPGQQTSYPAPPFPDADGSAFSGGTQAAGFAGEVIVPCDDLLSLRRS